MIQLRRLWSYRRRRGSRTRPICRRHTSNSWIRRVSPRARSSSDIRRGPATASGRPLLYFVWVPLFVLIWIATTPSDAFFGMGSRCGCYGSMMLTFLLSLMPCGGSAIINRCAGCGCQVLVGTRAAGLGGRRYRSVRVGRRSRGRPALRPGLKATSKIGPLSHSSTAGSAAATPIWAAPGASINSHDLPDELHPQARGDSAGCAPSAA